MSERGVYDKYNVERTDGKPIDEWCFVLEIDDPLARAAMLAYADLAVLKAGKQQLALDLYEILDAYTKEHPDAK